MRGKREVWRFRKTPLKEAVVISKKHIVFQVTYIYFLSIANKTYTVVSTWVETAM